MSFTMQACNDINDHTASHARYMLPHHQQWKVLLGKSGIGLHDYFIFFIIITFSMDGGLCPYLLCPFSLYLWWRRVRDTTNDQKVCVHLSICIVYHPFSIRFTPVFLKHFESFSSPMFSNQPQRENAKKSHVEEVCCGGVWIDFHLGLTFLQHLEFFLNTFINLFASRLSGGLAQN
jgi:hypothetical protein